MSLMSWGRGCCTKPRPPEYYGAAVWPVWNWEKRGGGGRQCERGKTELCIITAVTEGWAGAVWERTVRTPEPVCQCHLNIPAVLAQKL